METTFDPSMNFLYRRHRQLDSLFQPKTVAVIGATENPGSVGRTVMQNLLASKKGFEVIPVNPKRPSVLGVQAYPNIKSIPLPVELAVIVTPAKTVPSIISDCADIPIPAAIVISAGFKEMGAPGIALEEEIARHVARGKMRIIGPNCLGVMNPNTHLNATFAAGMALPGKLAFLSQSGALCTAVLDWSLKEKVGFSAFVSIGSMLDVGWGDLIHYFGNDPWTESILIYMESLGDARHFLSAAREVALSKPIILIKAGRSAESAQAAASHTGALAGSDDAFDAALRRVGVLRVDTIEELFSMAQTLAKQPLPKGPHLTIVTNAGGPGVIATDALVAEGGKLTTLSPKTVESLNQILPPQWSRNNPIDVLGDASAELYGKAIEVAAADPGGEGMLVILTPQDMTDAKGTAEQLRRFAKGNIPLLASWMGADAVAEGRAILAEAGIPQFDYPDAACKAFAQMWRYSERLRGIYETPAEIHEEDWKIHREEVSHLLGPIQREGRTLLDEYESKKVLEAYEIPTVPTEIATTGEEAVSIARKFGFPIVLKLYSKTITHKSDVGGVKLNLSSEKAVLTAFAEIQASVSRLAKPSDFQGVTVQPMIRLEGYELIVGSTIDPQLGPLLLFGSGGQLVEVYKDRALTIPPLTTTLARRWMEQTKIYEALKGVRGRGAVNFKKLEELLVRFSLLVVEHPEIRECDINPLLISEHSMIALDARIVLHEASPPEWPKPAIRPYPSQYVEEMQLKGASIRLRPIRPEDETRLIQFHQDLSHETVRQRYLKAVHYEERIAHSRLLRICFNDYDREIALVAESPASREILGVARMSFVGRSKDATFALVVKDRWQNKGIGSALMKKVLQVAREEKVETLAASMLEENQQMQKVLKKLGFSIVKEGDYLLATQKLR